MKCKNYVVDTFYEINTYNEGKLMMAILLSLRKKGLLTNEQVAGCKEVLNKSYKIESIQFL